MGTAHRHLELLRGFTEQIVHLSPAAVNYFSSNFIFV